MSTLPESIEHKSDAIVLTPRSGRTGSPLTIGQGRYHIGSSAECDFVLPAEGIADRHCVVVSGPNSTVLKAWDPRTWVNDNPVLEEARLVAGDRLAIGPVIFDVTTRNAFAESAATKTVAADRQPGTESIIEPVEAKRHDAVLPRDGRDIESTSGAVRSEQDIDRLCTVLQQHIDELRTDIDGRQDALAGMLKAQSETVAEVASRQRAVDDAERRIADADRRSALLSELLAEVRFHADQVITREQGFERKRQQFQTESTRSETELQVRSVELDERDAAQRERESALRNERDALKSEREQWKSARETEEREFAAREDDLAGRRDSAAERETELDRRNRELTDRSRELDRQESLLHEQRDRHEEDAERRDAELDRRQNAIDARLSGLAQWEAEVNERGESIESREQDIGDRTEACERRELELEQAREKLAAEQVQISTRESSTADREQKCAEREAAVVSREESVGTELARLDQRDLEIAQREAQAEARLVKLQQREAELAERFEEQESELESARDEVRQQAASLESERQTQADQSLQETRERLEQEHVERLALLEQREADLSERERDLELRSESLSEQTAIQAEAADDGAALDVLRDELERERAELASMRSQLDQEQTECSQRNEQRYLELCERETELSRQAGDIESRSRELTERESRIDELADETARRERELAERIQEFEDRSANPDPADDAQDDRVAELESLVAEWTQERTVLEQQLEESRTEADELRARNSELQHAGAVQADASASDQLSQLRELTSIVASEHGYTPGSPADSDGADEADKGPQADLINQIKQLQQEFESEKTQYEQELESLRTELSRSLSELEVQNSGLQARQSELDQQAADLEARESDVRSSMQEIAELRSELEQRLNATEVQERHESGQSDAEIGRLLSDLADCNAEIVELRERLESTESDSNAAGGNVDISAELEQKHQSLAAREAELDQRIEKLDERSGEVAQRESAVEQQEAELKRDREDLMEARRQLELIRAEIESERSAVDAHSGVSSLPATDVPPPVLDPEEHEQAEEHLAHLRSELAGMFGMSEDSHHAGEAVHTDQSPEPSEVEASTTSDGEPADADETPLPADPDDPDYVRSYMERLLSNTRSGATEAAPPVPSAQVQEQETATEVSSVLDSEFDPMEGHESASFPSSRAADGDERSDAEEVKAPGHPDHEDSHVGPAPPLRQTVDKQTVRADIDSLRQVANYSARTAIASYAWKKCRGQMVLRATMTGISLVFAVVLFVIDRQGMGATLAYSFACLALSVISGIELAYSVWRIRNMNPSPGGLEPIEPTRRRNQRGQVPARPEESVPITSIPTDELNQLLDDVAQNASQAAEAAITGPAVEPRPASTEAS